MSLSLSCLVYIGEFEQHYVYNTFKLTFKSCFYVMTTNTSQTHITADYRYKVTPFLEFHMREWLK